MNCRRVERLLSDHLEGLLPAHAAREVAAHLAGCTPCSRLRGDFLAAGAALRAPLDPRPLPDIDRRAIQCWMAERDAARHSRWLFRWARSLPSIPSTRLTATAAALLAALTLILTHQERRPSRPDRPRALAQFWEGEAPAEPRRLARTGNVARQEPRPPKLRPHSAHLLRPGNRVKAGSSETAAQDPRPKAQGPRPNAQRLRPNAYRLHRDDLALINGDPAHSARQGALLAPGEWDRIEERVRKVLRVGDDFVHIPFPRLVSVDGTQPAAAVESYRREAAIVDARLSRAVTLAAKATALSDLCDQLRRDTGIHLEAGRSVADEKVTVFCEKMPLRDVMRQLARPFGYTWLRSTLNARRSTLDSDNDQPGAGQAERRASSVERRASSVEYRYELVQDLRSQLTEEELRNRDRGEALLALDREMQRYRPYLALSPDEALARSKSAPPETKKLLENLAGRGWGPIQMYFRLSPRDLELLRAGRGLDLAQDPRPRREDQLLPPEIARGVLQSMRDVRIRADRGGEGGATIGRAEQVSDGVPPIAFPDARARVRLRFGHSELGQVTFDGHAGVYVGPRITIGGTQYATGTSSAVRDPQNAGSHAAWARDPALKLRVTVKPRPSCRPAAGAAGPAGSPGDPRATSADALEALHRATGLPIVADSYTRLFPLSTVSLPDTTLFDALNRLSDTMRLRWQRDKEGGWLQFRSVSYYDDRLKEVPNRLLFRWAASRREHGALTLEDLVEIAQLTDVQLDSPTMAEGAQECFDLLEWKLARNGSVRPHLRYLATLSPAQRQLALTPAGLLVSQLSLAQQQQFLAHLGSRLEWAHVRSLEGMSGAVVRVEYQQPGGFRWIIPAPDARAQVAGRPAPPDLWRGGMFTLSPVRERTREATLQAARRLDPSVDATQIAPTELALAVVYLLIDPETGGLHPLGVRGVGDGARISW